MNQELIDRIATELMATQGKRYVALSTTANRNNPPFYVSGLRQGNGVAAANFIFAAPDLLPEVIARFDGRIEAFLLDTEIKNSLEDLVERAEKLIQKTPIVRIKPNDMTAMALDLWLAILLPTMRGISALIVGTGNIGAKIALMLAERGAEVRLLGRDMASVERIASGLNEIKRGHGHVMLADRDNPATGSSIILGCTPGISAVTSAMINQAAQDSIVIDVGNGTLFPEAVQAAHQRGISVFCLSSEAGFIGWIAALAHARDQIDHMKRRTFPNGIAVIGPGVLGAYGEIIVDDPDNWHRILGVCDGRGDVLRPEDGASFIQRFLDK
jgi:hypothetical protein